MSAVRISVVRLVEQREIQLDFCCGMLATIQESRRSLKLEIIEWVPT